MRVKIDEEEAAEESKSIYMYVYSERGGRTAIKRAASASHTNTQQNCWLKKKKEEQKMRPGKAAICKHNNLHISPQCSAIVAVVFL